MTVHAFSSNNSTTRNAHNTVDGTPYSTHPDDMWLSNEVTPWIVFDLDGIRRLNHLIVWNYAQSGYSNRGMNHIRLSGSLDGIVFSPLSAFPDGETPLREALQPGSSNTGEFVFVGRPNGGGTDPMAYLKIECLTNHGSTLSGLS